ncbi:hypothetical protein SRHO_G00299830 [Serrasalmus rhombeus]
MTVLVRTMAILVEHSDTAVPTVLRSVHLQAHAPGPRSQRICRTLQAVPPSGLDMSSTCPHPRLYMPQGPCLSATAQVNKPILQLAIHKFLSSVQSRAGNSQYPPQFGKKVFLAQSSTPLWPSGWALPVQVERFVQVEEQALESPDGQMAQCAWVLV